MHPVLESLDGRTAYDVAMFGESETYIRITEMMYSAVFGRRTWFVVETCDRPWISLKDYAVPPLLSAYLSAKEGRHLRPFRMVLDPDDPDPRDMDTLRGILARGEGRPVRPLPETEDTVCDAGRFVTRKPIPIG